MKTKCYNVYKFSELSEKAQAKAIDNLRNLNVDFEWWESTYEDAANIGLKITEFDIDRGDYCKGDFISGAEETAHKIEKDHGEICETFKTAKTYLSERDRIIDAAPKDKTGEFSDQDELDEKLDEADREFLRSLLADYLSNLRQEFDYQTSDEAIKDSILANDYDFTENGKLD